MALRLPPAAAALLAGDVPVQVCHLPLGGGEELLQLVLKGGVPGGGGAGRLGRGTVSLGRRPGCGRTGRRLPGLEGPLGALRGRQGLLDGQVQLAVLDGQELYLDGLPLLQEIMDIVDIGIGDLRNMYKAGSSALQRHKGAEFGDAGDFPL